jgi:ubiquitin-protein ligase E3 A
MNSENQQMLRKPLRIQFAGEPGIDEGGVKKEFFQLLFKELFNPDFAMFNYNEDTRCYYFNGKTFESPYNFELIGMLMALAPQNQCLLDIPIAPVCYKVLLDEKPDIDDLRVWDPKLADSFNYILNYEEETPLEDVL